MEREGGRWGTKGGREQDIQNQNLKILTLSAPPLSLLLFGPLLHLIERKNGVPVGVPLCDSRSAVAVRGGGKERGERRRGRERARDFLCFCFFFQLTPALFFFFVALMS